MSLFINWIAIIFASAALRYVFAAAPSCEVRMMMMMMMMMIMMMMQVVHGTIYTCLRAMFGLSVIGILVSIFSCMLVYQILRWVLVLWLVDSDHVTWPLIGHEWSPVMDTGLWLADHVLMWVTGAHYPRVSVRWEVDVSSNLTDINTLPDPSADLILGFIYPGTTGGSFMIPELTQGTAKSLSSLCHWTGWPLILLEQTAKLLFRRHRNKHSDWGTVQWNWMIMDRKITSF